MTRNKKIVLFLLLATPALVVFRSLLSGLSLAWGDAPYFYSDGFRELMSWPYAWTTRGNNLGGQNMFLWFYPLMLLYGALNQFFGLNNELIIRLLFYFPSVVLTIFSSYYFARYLKHSITICVFTSLLYTFNTYFLLVVDGGQAGIALAYGLFPLTLASFHHYVNSKGYKPFFIALLIGMLQMLADPRFTFLAFVVISIWEIIEHSYRKLFKLIPLSFCLIMLSMYWLFPLLYGGGNYLSLDVSQLHLLSILNGLTLYQPHWPSNEYGNVTYPPFYFLIFTTSIFVLSINSKVKKHLIYALLFLIFVFLLKGETPPVSFLYSNLIKLPFGYALRDSSKFFAPLLLFAGLLYGISVERLRKRLGVIALLGGYLFIFFAINEAFMGKLNFVLSNRENNSDSRIIYQKLMDDKSNFRTAWFPEKYPLAFHSDEKQALDAKDLVHLRVLARLNGGTYDKFNYIYESEFVNWYSMLGIKYLIFSGNPRLTKLNKEEQKNWDDLLGRVATSSGLLKTNWGTNTLIYQIADTKPLIVNAEKIIGVIGADDVVKSTVPFVFFEDGLLEPRKLNNLASNSLYLFFNKKDETDLAMSYLQKHFVSPSQATSSMWKVWGNEHYLEWKYELLVRGIKTFEFDYGKGLAMSTQNQEILKFKITALKGDYILALRAMSAKDSEPLDIEFNRESTKFENSEGGVFEWFIKDTTVSSSSGEVSLKNLGGTWVVNAIALIPKSEWVDAQNQTKKLLEKYKVVNSNELFLLTKENSYKKVEFERISPVHYKVNSKDGWLMFSDNFNPKWKLEYPNGSTSSLPFYSMINGFYIEHSTESVDIVFEGQESVRLGMYLTAFSFFSLALIYIYYKNAQKNP